MHAHNFVIEYSVAHKKKYHIFPEKHMSVSAAPGQNFTEERKDVTQIVENMVVQMQVKKTSSMQCILFYN